ncbi:hypothetical protein AMJ47_03035 [Parcubacteria bacterium DG_72]|nr:MAG: hypothetical protein AMJ47_03035 [Parcubacteria bacterium DG_72]
MGDVKYKIVQKPKCICSEAGIIAEDCVEGEYAPVNYWDDQCPTGFEKMNDLCGFLSKLPVEGDNDIGVPSYYLDSGCPTALGEEPCCVVPTTHVATGQLVKCHPDHVICATGDLIDCWNVDLKVPPVAGSVGQDWPESCSTYTVPEDGAVYGCDLWIEVTGFSTLEQPPSTPACDDGWITGDEECDSGIGCGVGYTCEACMCEEIGT